MDRLQKLIGEVRNQLYLVGIVQCIILAMSVYLLMLCVATETYALLTGMLVLVLQFWRSGLHRSNRQTAIGLIHRYAENAEFSLHLLDRSNLNIAEQMQVERIASHEMSFPFKKLYAGLRLNMAVLLAAASIYFFYPKTKDALSPQKGAANKMQTKKRPAKSPLPELADARVFVQPPAYTGLAPGESPDLNVRAIAGSRLRWDVRFNQIHQVNVKLANTRGEEVSFKKTQDKFQYTDAITGSGLYTIKAYYKDSLIYQSDFYKLEAVPDLAPKIEPASKELYKYHFLKDSKTVQVSAKISDDFQVKQAFIVATVARGSGENVKFREVKIPLSPANFKEATIQKTIDLRALNFAPGDELYYYWAAADNRQPEANFTKSDTYFIVYKDTAQIEEAELATMAVNIMPEYFRSQRQIIIDTEKLISRKKKLSRQAFNAASNEIGYDQKLLRLRYGQYLGEEFETNIGGGEAPEEGGNIVDAFTHHSDGTGEGAEHRAADVNEKHDHDHGKAHNDTESKDPLAALMEQYTHSHDDAETNTFYEESTRSLLKMALEQMWQSELHLRTYEPEKALPFENKALEYLKSAQQKARAYVRKSGYDPPPIKENEKRLTGELKEMAADFNSKKIYDQKTTAELAAEVLGLMDRPATDKTRQAKFRLAGNELSNRLVSVHTLKSEMQSWALVAILQKLTSAKPVTSEEKQRLKTELYKYANHEMQTRNGYSSGKKLEDAFWEKMR